MTVPVDPALVPEARAPEDASAHPDARWRRDGLRTALSAGRVGTWEWDVDSGEVRWDAVTEEIFGFPPGGFPGTYEAYASRIHPADLPEVQAAVQRSMDTKGQHLTEHRVVWPDGSVHWTSGSGAVVVGADGEPVGMVGVTVDITARKAAEAALAASNAELTALYGSEQRARQRAEDAAAWLQRLQQLTGRLAQARELTEVAEVVVSAAAASTGSDRVIVMVLTPDRSRLRLLRSSGGLDGPADGCEISVELDLPICRAVRAGEPVWLSTRAELEGDYPDTSCGGVLAKCSAYAGLPLVLDGVAYGALGLGFVAERTFSDEDRSFLMATAAHVTQALERARLDDAQREARAEAERARERLAFLAESSRVLASSLDYDGTLAELARLVVPQLADSCSVHVADGVDGSVRLVTAAHAEPGKESLLRRASLDSDAAMSPWVASVVSSGRSMLVEEFTDETTAALPLKLRELLAVLDVRSGMAVPLLVQGKPMGAMVLGYGSSGRRYDREDLHLVEELAARAAVAIDNARAHRRQSDVARTLQRSLLPPRIVEVPGMQVAARYRAVGDDCEVGGDFYDVFRVSPTRWGVVIGDVSGKGVAAASLTALARYTVRAAALREPTPSAVLRLLNDTVLADGDDERFCTVCNLLVEPEGGGLRVTLSSGGHPLPYVLRRDGVVEQVGTPGTGIGLVADPQLSDDDVVLAPGDALVLYTDGLTEARSPEGEFAFDLLEETLADCAGRTAEQVAALLEREILGFQGGRARDDMALLVIRAPLAGEVSTEPLPAVSIERTHGGDAHSAFNAHAAFDARFPAMRASVSAARHQLGQWIAVHAADAPEHEVADALLVVSEVVTNAARAARTGFRLRAWLDAAALHVEVADDGAGFASNPPPATEPGQLAEGGRGLFIIDALVDDCVLRTSDAGTSVHVVKTLRPDAS